MQDKTRLSNFIECLERTEDLGVYENCLSQVMRLLIGDREHEPWGLMKLAWEHFPLGILEKGKAECNLCRGPTLYLIREFQRKPDPKLLAPWHGIIPFCYRYYFRGLCQECPRRSLLSDLLGLDLRSCKDIGPWRALVLAPINYPLAQYHLDGYLDALKRQKIKGGIRWTS